MSEQDATPSYEQVVTTALDAATTDDNGKMTFGEDTPEHVQYAARTLKRQRDTQSAYTKGQQRNKALEAENSQLASSWEKDAVSSLDPSEKARLDELKFQDPDQWRNEIATLEDANRTKFKAKRDKIAADSSAESELERRESVLADYNAANPDTQLTDDVIANDLPPRITNKLANAEITFDEFLQEAHTFLNKGAKLAPGKKAPDDPSLADSRGTDSPSQEAFEEQNKSEYKDAIF